MLGGPGKERGRKNALLTFLAKNPVCANAQSPEDAYHSHWSNSSDQDQNSICQFLKRYPMEKSLYAILSSPCHIGTTKFALGTCKVLLKSRITEWEWLRKSEAGLGVEVCVLSIGCLVCILYPDQVWTRILMHTLLQARSIFNPLPLPKGCKPELVSQAQTCAKAAYDAFQKTSSKDNKAALQSLLNQLVSKKSQGLSWNEELEMQTSCFWESHIGEY